MTRLKEALHRRARGAEVWQLFDERLARPSLMHRSFPRAPATESTLEEALERAAVERATTRGRTVYVHIPFCDRICSFCGYSRRIPSSRQEVGEFLEALDLQMERTATSSWTGAGPLEAISFGGGTPTSLDTTALEGLIDRARDHFGADERSEVTVEACPGDLTPIRSARLRRAGVTRLSLGVQSFDTAVRSAMGRRLDEEGVRRTIHEAAGAGFEQMCVDLISGLPAQSVVRWRQDLETLDELPVTGASVYPLIRFESARLTRTPGALGPESLEQDYARHREVEAFVAQRGGRFLSPVQLAFTNEERALAVTARARGADMLGLGPAALSLLGSWALVATPAVEDYIEAERRGASALTRAVACDHRARELIPALRLVEDEGRVAATLFETDPALGALREGLIELDLAASRGEALLLTPSGRFWAGTIASLIGETIRRIIEGGKYRRGMT